MEKSSPAHMVKNYIPWGFRHWIQLAVLLLTIAIGLQFYVHVMQAEGTGAVTVGRPEGVEGFLPIGALMGWKLFFTTGSWDTVHPAGMVIIGFAALISFIFRKSFCSWFCPVGTISEWLWKLGDRLRGRNYKIPLLPDYVLRSLKYLLLGFFVYIITGMDTVSIESFLKSPYYRVADVKMLHFFTRMSLMTAIVLAALIILSVFIRNFWCRYLCPYGALMTVFSIFSPLQIRRNEKQCIRCGKCATVCPHQIPVDEKQIVFSPECSGCLDCISACPVKDTLEMKTAYSKAGSWKVHKVGIAVLLVFVLSVYVAQISGHWESKVSTREFRIGLKIIDSPVVRHPSVQFSEE